MTRCNDDGVFYRVFCVTLLAIAVTFTVILTNVFVDIDGLLFNEKSNHHTTSSPPPPPPYKNDVNDIEFPPDDSTTDSFYSEEKNYEETEDTAYRRKRSLETQNFMFHVTNPKMKSVLTNRLTTLLQELDEEESKNNNIVNDKEETKIPENSKGNDEEYRRKEEIVENKMEKNDNMLHLAMHNILLQGIIGHMDLNDVYKKVHSLVKNFEESKKDTNEEDKEKEFSRKTLEPQKKEVKETEKVSPVTTRTSMTEENKFFKELVHCEKLQDDIKNNTLKKTMVDNKKNTKQGPKVLIKTVINITTLNNDRNIENDVNKEKIKGVIKLIYNGKSIQFDRMASDEKVNSNNVKNKEVNTTKDNKITKRLDEEKKEIKKKKESTQSLNEYGKINIPDSYLNKVLVKYFQKYSDKSNNDPFVASKENSKDNQNKRMKRHIKVRYEKEAKHEKIKPKRQKFTDKHDDELYVEIETHIDSKGLIGEKKKKLIKSLIDKIQQAIHMEKDVMGTKKKKIPKPEPVKKRSQNSLDVRNESVFVKKISAPFDNLVGSRHLDPISKSIKPNDPMPDYLEKSGEAWHKRYDGPGIFTLSKSINSAELSEMDLGYDTIMKENGIPQRLLQPINTDTLDKIEDDNYYVDMGKLRYLINNVDGRGITVGFNQYMDQPLDSESLKLFTGVENIIKTYHQKYDDNSQTLEVNNFNEAINSADKSHVITKRNLNEYNNHIISRRSVKNDHDEDYHSNEYKAIFKPNYLSYNSYQEIYENNRKGSINNLNNPGQRKHKKEFPIIIDETFLTKHLKPSEIFGLANLFDRKKRSLNMRKMLKMKTKTKFNKFLNTNSLMAKTIYLKGKRKKRQIDKIRIIASDNLSTAPKSNENVFLVSDENIFSDRAVVQQVNMPEGFEMNGGIVEDNHNMLPTYISDHTKLDPILLDNIKMEPSIKYQEPDYHNIERFQHRYHFHQTPNVQISAKYQNDQRSDENVVNDVFAGISRRNALMSKYPHILMEEMTRSKEDDAEVFGKLIEASNNKNEKQDVLLKTTTETVTPMVQIPLQNDEYMSDLKNYKLSIKVVPKNVTDLHTGFKQVHTCINKTYNRDGVFFSTVVNISSVSKMEAINKTNKIKTTTTTTSPTQSPLVKHIKKQQEKMKFLLQEHKRSIDQQLNHLKIEKNKIETIVNRTDIFNSVDKKNNSANDFIDVVLPGDPPQSTRLSRSYVNMLIATALGETKTRRDNEFSTTVQQLTTTTTTTTTTTPLPVTTVTTTTVYTTPKKSDYEKMRLLKTIKHNENLTNEILKRIDMNTEILQIFLKKLSDKMEATTTTTTTVPFQKTFTMNIPQEYRPIPESIPFYGEMPNMSPKNEPHTIPFVYAYQRPYAMPNKVQESMASVVYHGHIHTNALQNPKVTKFENVYTKKLNDFHSGLAKDLNLNQNIPVKRNENKTKFFINNMKNSNYNVLQYRGPNKDEFNVSPPRLNNGTNF